MAKAYGIHLGNTSACLASNGIGAPLVRANDSGDRVTPAVLALNGNEWEIGLPAKARQLRCKSFITNNKRLMNYDWNDDDLLNVEQSSSCRIIVNDERRIRYEFVTDQTTLYTGPDEIATKIYGKLFTIASQSMQTEDDLKVVLAAPLYWSIDSRKRLSKCAELAGFDDLQVISEPAAALLAYNIGEATNEDINVLVYRLGGSSCEVSIVKVYGGFIKVEKNIYRSDLGGQYLTRELAEYLAQEFSLKWKLDPKESRRAMSKLILHADNCKHVLSTLNSAHVFIESLLDGVDWSQTVTRARFENIISCKISACTEPIETLIQNFDEKIHKIVLCGGSMKIPKLQSTIANLLPEAEILSGISPDEVIAIGCARQAGLLLDILDSGLNDVNINVEFISSDIYLKYLDKTIHLFKEGSPLYAQTTFEVEADDSMKSITFTLYEDSTKEYFAEETFDIQNCIKPFTVKAMLEQSKILLQLQVLK